MRNKISRADLAQITKRVTMAGFVFDASWKCFICGKKFQHNACPHSVSENEELVELIKSEK